MAVEMSFAGLIWLYSWQVKNGILRDVTDGDARKFLIAAAKLTLQVDRSNVTEVYHS
jgi:hypothetical protein